MKIKFLSTISLLILIIVLLSNNLKAQQIFDTLIIRDICSYCEKAQGNRTKCFCSNDCDKSEFQQFARQYGNGISHLIIENPSKTMNCLDFSKFPNLKVVNMFGTDWDLLTAIHPEMMKIKTLKKIELSNIMVPELEVERLKKYVSDIEISGLDGTVNTDGRDTAFDLTIVVKKDDKYALWSYPYESKPLYVFDYIQRLGYGKYICNSESGCQFINTRLNSDQKYTLHQEIWYSYPNVQDPLSRYVVNNHGMVRYQGLKYFELTGANDVNGNFTTTEKKEVLDSLALISGGYFGLLSNDFKIIIPAVYTDIRFPAKVHYRELANVVPDKINEYLNWVDCSELYSQTNNSNTNVQELILVDSGTYKGAYNFDGKQVIPVKYTDIIPMIDGNTTRYYCFEDNRKGLVFDQKGTIIEPIVLSKKNRLQYPLKSDETSSAEYPYNPKNLKDLTTLMQEIIDKKSVRFYNDISASHSATRVPEKITTIYVTVISVPGTKNNRTVFSISLFDTTKDVKIVIRFNDLLLIAYKNPELMKQLEAIEKSFK
ncbi:MAG: hypothetical protein WCP69_01460 [Bacteroidota bacterium]